MREDKVEADPSQQSTGVPAVKHGLDEDLVAGDGAYLGDGRDVRWTWRGRRTEPSVHVEEIAQKLDNEASSMIAVASGDGLPHPIFNGLARQANPLRSLRKAAVEGT